MTKGHEYLEIISKEKLAETLLQLDQAVVDVIDAGKAREGSYGDKRDLLKRKRELEGRIEVEEAQALMQVIGEGKAAHAYVAGEKVSLTNDAARTAYRHYHSKEARQELAQTEGELSQLDVERFQATDNWETAKAAADLVRNKAELQSSLLRFLANE